MSRNVRESSLPLSGQTRSRTERAAPVYRCTGCKEREDQIAQLRGENHALELEVRELKERVRELTDTVQGQERDIKVLLSREQQLRVENDHLIARAVEPRPSTQLFPDTVKAEPSPEASALLLQLRSVQLQLQEVSRERDELATAGQHLAEDMVELRTHLQNLESNRAMEAEGSAHLKDQLQECEALRFATEKELRELQSLHGIKSPSKNTRSVSLSPAPASGVASLQSRLKALQEENVSLRRELRAGKQIDDKGRTLSGSPSGSQSTRMADALRSAEESCAVLNRRVCELEAQLDKSSKMVADRNAELLCLRESVRVLSAATAPRESHAEGECAGREGGNGRTSPRLLDPQSYKGSSPGQAKMQVNKAELIPQLQRVLGSLGGENSNLCSDNVRLLQENTQLCTLVQELTCQLSSLQAFRDEALSIQRSVECRCETDLMKSLEVELNGAHSAVFKHEAQLVAACRDASQLQLGLDGPHLERFVSPLKARLAEAEVELGSTFERLKFATKAVVQSALQQATFAEQRCAQHVAENKRLVNELGSAECQMADKADQICRLQSDLAMLECMLQRSGQDVLQLRASVGGLEIANSQLEATVSLLSGESEFVKQLLRSSQMAAQDELSRLRREVSALTTAAHQAQLESQERELTILSFKQERDLLFEKCSDLRSEVDSVRAAACAHCSKLKEELRTCATLLDHTKMGQQEKCDELNRLQQQLVRQSLDECANRDELEKLRSAAFSECSRLKTELDACNALLNRTRCEQQRAGEDIVRLQEELASTTANFRQAQLQSQEREMALGRLEKDHGKCFEESVNLRAECSKLRDELATVGSAAQNENARAKEELRACASQLESTKIALQEKCDEAVRLQKEISAMTLSEQDRNFAFVKLKQDQIKLTEECSKLRGELVTCCGENGRIKEELKHCATQLEQGKVTERQKIEEVIRLQEELAGLAAALHEAQHRADVEREAQAKLTFDYERSVADCAQLRAELVAVSDAALCESTRAKDELRACAMQLEHATKEQEIRRDEMARKQQEISSMLSSARERELAFAALKQDFDTRTEELLSIRGAAQAESTQLKNALNTSSSQLEEAKKLNLEKSSEIACLQQENSVLNASLQEAKVQVQELESAIEKLKQDRDHYIDECSKLLVDCSKIRTELAASSGAAVLENSRVQGELQACAFQLERATEGQQEQVEEIVRLQNQITTLQLELEKLTRDRDVSLEECARVSTQLATLRCAALGETNQLKEELQSYIVQLEQARKACQAKSEEVFRLQQDHSALLASFREAQLQMQEKDTALAKFHQERDLHLKELDKLRADCFKFQSELGTVGKAALAEVALLKNELNASAVQLEQTVSAQNTKTEEVIRLRQEISTLTASLRDAQLQAHERGMKCEELERVRAQIIEDCAKLRAELVAVADGAKKEKGLLKDELLSQTAQLQQAALGQQEQCQEVIRLMQEISALTVSAQNREVVYEKLKQDHCRSLEECARLRTELATIRDAALTENARLKGELGTCTLQAELVRKTQHGKAEEIAQLQQEVCRLTAALSQTQQDCCKLRAELATGSCAALAENVRVKEELSACAAQLELAVKAQREEHRELVRLRQELQLFRR